MKPGIMHGLLDALRGAWTRAAAQPAEESEAIAVTISLRDVALLADAYDQDAREHAHVMLRRAVLENTAEEDMVVQLSDDEFAVVMAGISEAEAHDRIHSIYEALAIAFYDAGYECSLAIALDDEEPTPQIKPVPVGQVCLN
ncbi:GGDEF domain-containing protein [bacterium]|nr:MAG: GGDEF domain-containing protein [bacterium]